MTAQDLLTQAAAHMAKRAEQYDQQDGERSVPAVVKAFNAITGHELSDADGWLFLTLLKLVRAQTAKGDAAKDSAEDAVAYAALFGEAFLLSRKKQVSGMGCGKGGPCLSGTGPCDCDPLGQR